MATQPYIQTRESDRSTLGANELATLGGLELSDRLAVARSVLKTATATEKAVTAEAKTRLEKDAACVPGWALSPGSSTTWDMERIAADLGLSEADMKSRYATVTGYAKVVRA